MADSVVYATAPALATLVTGDADSGLPHAVLIR
jgi:hypothetical protein